MTASSAAPTNLAPELESLDRELLSLLERRATLVTETARLSPGSEPTVEQRQYRLAGILKVRAELATASLPEAAVASLFRDIDSACSALCAPKRIGFLGPAGTFSHMAARQAFGLGQSYLEFPNFPEIFTAVERGQLDYGVVPLENSTEGSITLTHDRFLTSSALIRSEIYLDVTLCLVGRERDLSRVTKVYSHPQPLGQARSWLGNHVPQAQLLSTSSTMVAARHAAEEPGSVAVASRLAAELLELEVLAESIQDLTSNVTRFVVLAPSDAAPTGRDKTSLVFSTRDERGALLRALSIFDQAGLNLSRIESRPGRDRPWEYVFFADVEGHRLEPAMATALEALRGVTQNVKVLGSYPRSR